MWQFWVEKVKVEYTELVAWVSWYIQLKYAQEEKQVSCTEASPKET